MAAKVKLYCELMRERLDDLSFEQKRDVLDALQAQFTLDKEGERVKLRQCITARELFQVGHRQWGDSKLLLTIEAQGSAAGHHYVQVWAGS